MASSSSDRCEGQLVVDDWIPASRTPAAHQTHATVDDGPAMPGSEVVDIVADSPEAPSETFGVLRARHDVALTVATLQYGDYSIAGQVSFKRKSADDLGRSTIDGRLFRQMSALRLRAKRPILLIEGLQPPEFSIRRAVARRPRCTPSGVPLGDYTLVV
jgi:ERCC4-type nuclease